MTKTLRRLLITLGLSLPLLLASVQVVGHDLADPVTTLLAGALHLPRAQVRVGSARLHPLGELVLAQVRVALNQDGQPGLRAARAVVYFDPLEGLLGRLRLRGASATTVRATATPLGLDASLDAAEATLVIAGPGRARVVVRDAVAALPLLPGAPLRVEHLSADLIHGSPARLAASGVYLGAAGPAELLVASGAAGGSDFRVALSGGAAAGSAGPGSLHANMRMNSLLLPTLLGPAVDLSSTRASGSFQLSIDSAQRSGSFLLGHGAGSIAARGQVMLADVGVNHPLLTPVALPNLTLVLDGELRLSRKAAEAGQPALWLSTPGLSLALGEARLSLTGDVELRPRGAGYRASLELILDEIECSRLLASLPLPLLPKLEGLGVSGRIGGLLGLTVDSQDLPELDLTSDVDIGCQVVSDPPTADVRGLLDPHLSIERPGEDGRPRHLPLGPRAPGADGVPGFQPIDGLPWPLVRTFLVAEDNQFYQHHGFDTAMIAHALGTDLQERRTSRGASTITQQLAKNMWLGQERALGRKLEEAVLAWRIEQIIPKRRVLEVYLNLMELGSGIYGISMAAHHYFGLPASKLSLDQAAQLAALLPAPRRGMDAAWSRRYHDILHRTGTAPVPRRNLAASPVSGAPGVSSPPGVSSAAGVSSGIPLSSAPSGAASRASPPAGAATPR